MRKIERIVLHCSGSDRPEDNSVQAIRHLHTAGPDERIQWGTYRTFGRGWKDIGYHWVVTTDGTVWPGRPVHEIGAHCEGHNQDSIGICVCGNAEFLPHQMQALADLVIGLMDEYKISVYNIYGHCELNSYKTCPNFNVKGFLKWAMPNSAI